VTTADGPAVDGAADVGPPQFCCVGFAGVTADRLDVQHVSVENLVLTALGYADEIPGRARKIGQDLLRQAEALRDRLPHQPP